MNSKTWLLDNPIRERGLAKNNGSKNEGGRVERSGGNRSIVIIMPVRIALALLNFYSDHKVTPDNLKTNAGITTGELKIDETGKWRFRAMCNFPGAPWSEWRHFVVDTLSKVPPLEKKP